MEQPGRSVLAWPPKAASRLPLAERREIHRELLAGATRFAQHQRARFVQALLHHEDREQAPVFAAAGFHRLATLIYLKRELNGPCDVEPRTGVEYHAYAPALHDDFLSVLERSYIDSMDCPELTGVRAAEEILQSHRAQGEYTPEHWMLVRERGQWAGCLLLAGLRELDAIEVAYVAVLPHARAQGLGRELTRRAIELGKAAGARWLTLAVDSRNRPARRLYDQMGFEPWDERDAHLLLLEPADRNLDRWPKSRQGHS
jgi:ribosomal protein S18 acetylase RimI-like enzyme